MVSSQEICFLRRFVLLCAYAISLVLILMSSKCLQSAMAVVRHLSEVYAPSGYLKYAPDCFFVMGGFCSAFVLKVWACYF
jgi:hypothetical protein